MLADVFENTLAGYWDWDILGNREYLSPRFKSMFGYAEDEMENSPEAWQTIIFPEDLPRVVEAFDRHVKTRGRKPFRVEVRYRHKNGSTVWVICAGKVVEWTANGDARRAVGCHIDITDRKRAEEELRANEKLLEMFFSQSHAGFFFMSLDAPIDWAGATEDEKAALLDEVMTGLRVTKVNQAMLDQYGAGKEDLLGATPSDFFAHDPARGRSLMKVLCEHGRWSGETQDRKSVV